MATMKEARGRPVFTSDGERLGDVDMIFDDTETRKPEWIAIATGVSGRKLVPVEGSELREEGVFVNYSVQQVRSTPDIEGDQIGRETERRLYSHYGLPYSERRSSTGLPERAKGRRSAPGSRRRGRGRATTRDEPTRDELYQEAKRLDIQGRSKMNK